MDKRAVEQLLRWKNAPQLMVRELFGVTPDAWQDEALAAFPTSPREAMKACVGPGKTAVLAWIGWNFILTRPHSMTGAVSITSSNLRSNLWAEFARWRNKSNLLQSEFEQTTTAIFQRQHPQTWKIEARSWAKDADAEQIGNSLAGLHANYVMWLLDETGDYPEAVLPVCEGIFSGSPIEAHIVQAGNPTRRSGPLWRACTTARDLWKLITITGDPDNPKRSPRISIEIARQQIRQYGRDNPWVKVRILGEFPDADFNALIGAEEVEMAMERIYREDQLGNAPMVIGVDVAREGDDASVIFPRRGLQGFTPKLMRNVNSLTGAGAVARAWTDLDADGVFVDATGGFGAGWIDQLQVLGRTPIGIQFSSEASKNNRYANKRTEMYFEVVEWIRRGGALPKVPEVVAALSQTNYTFQRDRLLLEPKEVIKAKLGYSPDHADALCFVAETQIATPTGSVPIESLRVGDVVLTPFGQSKVARMWLSETAVLSTVALTNGAELKGKPDHKVFAYGYGQVPLDALTLTMDLSPLSERWKWVSASALFTEARSTGFKTLVGILPPVSQFTASACCIAASGLSAMDLFRTAMRSITKIATGETAISTISNFSPRPSTERFTQMSGSLPGRIEFSTGRLNGPEKQPALGTHPQKDSRGTVNTGRKVGRVEKRSDASAFGAAPHFGASPQVEQNTAPKAASRLTLTSDTRPMFERAIGAVARLLRTATGTQRVAPASVRTESVPPTLVYNLTLERDNAYYANGILVFNCLTFAEPVTPRDRMALPRRPYVARQDFDPFRDAMRVQEPSGGDYDPFRSGR